MANNEYLIRFEPHGRQTRVPDTGRSVLEWGLAAGLNLPRSCRSGHCGACRARLVAGTVAYPNGPPLGLMEEEVAAGEVLLCQAVPRSDLTVDVRLIADVGEVEIKTLPCRVGRVEVLTSGLRRVTLRLPAVEGLPLQPGQCIDVLYPDGRRGRFPAANPGGDEHALELRLSACEASQLREGDLLRIEGPFPPISD